MNADLIIKELVGSGYVEATQPLHIADLDFKFSGVLTGPNGQDNLTLVLDGEGTSLIAAERRIRAFSVVLERSKSKRPITVIVIGKAPDKKAMMALESLARVVSVDPVEPLKESLFSLLPVILPAPIAASLSADEVLKKTLGTKPDDVKSRLLKAGRESAEKVRITMHQILTEIEKREV